MISKTRSVPMSTSALLLCAAISLTANSAIAKPTYTYQGQPITKIQYRGLELAEEAYPLLKSENYSEALPLLEKANDMAPGYSHILSNLAYVTIRLGQAPKAIPYIKKAMSLEPDDASMVRNLAMAYVSAGEPAQATAAVQRFISEHPSHRQVGELNQYLGSIQEEVDRQTKAKATEGADKKDSYIAYASAETGMTRWDFLSKTSLKVFINSPTGVRGWQQQFGEELQDSFELWSKASDNKVKFEFVSDRDSADITVTWTDSVADLRSPDEGGEARVKYGAKGIMHSDIFILTFDEAKAEEKQRHEIRGVCLHEIGHSLGLMGHSPNADDVMYFSDTGSTMRPQLSQRDVRTLSMLYSTDQAFVPIKGSVEEKQIAKINLFNTAVDDYNSKRYEQAIARCRSALEVDSTFDDAKKLMADALDNSAIELMEKDDYTRAEQVLKLAIDVRKTLGQSKDLGLSLQNYAILLRNTNRMDEAAKVEAEVSHIH